MSVDNVADIEPRVQYVAIAAQTDFDYPFPIFANADLIVDVDGVTKTLTTDYTVTGAGDDTGGTVTFLVAMTGNEVVTIYRDIAIERTADFQQNGPLRSASFNDELDKLIMMLQQIEARIGRSLRLPITGEATSSEAELSPIANWLDKYITINANGVPEPADIVTGTISASVVGGLLNPQTTPESDNGISPTDTSKRPGEIERYGAASGSNSATAIQDAIDQAMESTGAPVVVSQGSFTINTRLEADSPFAMYGSGPNSILKGTASGTAILLLAQNASTAIKGIRLLDIVFDGNAGGQLSAGIVQLNNAQDFVVDSCTFKNGTRVSGVDGVNGLALSIGSVGGPAPSGVVSNCISENCSKAGVNASTGCDGVKFINGTSRNNTGNGTTPGVQLQDSFRSLVSGYTITGNQGCGVLITAIDDDGPFFHKVDRCDIRGNGTGSSEGAGVRISSLVLGQVHFEIDVADNNIGANGSGITPGTSAVELVNASSVRVLRNRSRDSTLHGVSVEADNGIDSDDLVIGDNDFADGNTSSNASGAAIFIDGVCNNLRIVDNKARGNGSSGFEYGAFFTTDCVVDGLVMRDNDFAEMATANYAFQGTVTNFDIEAKDELQTTADGLTTAFTFPVADNSACRVRVTVHAEQDDGTNQADYVSEALIYRDGGSATVRGSVATIVAPIESDATWSIELGVTGNSFRLRVDGAASQTVNWKWKVEAVSVP